MHCSETSYQKQWRKTQEYETQYSVFQSKGDNLASIVEMRLPYILENATTIEEKAARTETATHGDLHRGYYCPSPILDIIIGNIRRGKLMKRLTSRSKSYYLYGFDNDDRLLWAKRFFNGYYISMEYLFREGNHVYGLTVRKNGTVEAVTDERYENGKLVSYLYALLFPGTDGVEWIELRQEDYTYDHLGFKACDLYECHPIMHLLEHKRITFERREGYLKEYCWETLIGLNDYKVIRTSPVYKVDINRKA